MIATALYRLMLKNDDEHTLTFILINLNILIKQGRVVKIDRAKEHKRAYYGIPLTREDGTKYLIETLLDGSKKEIEV